MISRPRPVEWVLAVYVAVVAGVTIGRMSREASLFWIALAHLLVLVLLVLFRDPRLGSVGRYLRIITPILLLPALYVALDLMGGFGARPAHDIAVQRWEAAIFGGQVSRTWWQTAPSPQASALFHAAYLSYYLIVPFPVVLLLVRGQKEAAERVVLAVVMAFTACYLCFIFFPVAGPYYEFPRPAPWFLANLPARLVYGLLDRGSSYGAAFPSSHVAASWAAAAATLPAARTAGIALGAAALLVTIGAVYCQMHYAVDALAGIGIAMLAILAVRLFGRYLTS